MLEQLNGSDIITVLVALVIAMSLHETMHAFTSYWLGDDTAQREGRISLNPLRHIDPFLTIVLPAISLLVFGVPIMAAKPVPFNPNRVRFEEYGAALVGIAGPLTNLLLAVMGAGLLHLTIASISFGAARALSIFVQINAALFIFNMIPIPPLDGSRLLYAFAPEAMQEIMARLEGIGIFIVFGLVLAVPAFGDLLINLNRSLLNLLFRI